MTAQSRPPSGKPDPEEREKRSTDPLLVLERGPIAFANIDLGGNIRSTNGRFARMMRIADGSHRGLSLESFFSEGSLGRARFRELLHAGTEVDEEELELQSTDEDERRVRLSMWPVTESGRPASWHVGMVDVSPRASPTIPDEGEDRLRTLGDSAPVLLWMAGTDSLCFHFNHRWLTFTGRTLEQEIGSGWTEGIHAEDLQECLDTYLGAFVERREFRMEYRLRNAYGQFRWILDTGIPRFTRKGQFLGYIGSCIDITEIRDARDALARLRDTLEQRVAETQETVRLREEFMLVVAHELRTPLSALLLQLGTLKGRATPPAGQNERVDKCTNATKRLVTLVETLLDLPQASEGRVALQREWVDLARVAQEVSDRLAEAAGKAGCEIRLVNQGNTVGHWDRVRLEQVATNLLSNALKYGAGKPIEVRVERRAETAALAVHDGGMGVAERDVSRIFDKFERAAPIRHYGGLGLGLYVARQIVEAHGGRVYLQSEPGAGATFTVEFPIERGDIGDERPSKSHNSPGRG